MNIVVIDYRLLAFKYSFHAHRPFGTIFQKLSQLLLSKGINNSKLIFAVDTGPSIRRKIYPEYKVNRVERQKKEAPAEQRRRKEFETNYKNSLKWLHNFGTVIDLYGIEADDIGSIIAHRFANTEHQVTLVSSDKDWSSFLVADNLRVLHVDRNTFITRDTCVNEYELDPQGIFWLQCFAGSDKENVKGLYKFGEKTFKKVYDAQEEKDFDKIKDIIKSDYLDKSYRGIALPEGVNYEDMVALNKQLFTPMLFENLPELEQQEFLVKFNSPREQVSYDNLTVELLCEHNISLHLDPRERLIYKLK